MVAGRWHLRRRCWFSSIGDSITSGSRSNCNVCSNTTDVGRHMGGWVSVRRRSTARQQRANLQLEPRSDVGREV
eukprot:2309965-Rhodomonas_salina.1